jgi:hypothetical protein
MSAPVKMLWCGRRGYGTFDALQQMSDGAPHVGTFQPEQVVLTGLEQDSTVIAVIEMSQSKWLVAAVIPGVERQPLKKIDPDEEMLLKLLHRWQSEAGRAGREIKRIVVAHEAGRDGFWLARWLWARGIEAYVIHPTSIAVPREHRRAKTDRLDTELLKRAFLGWLRGEKRHCSMAAIPTLEEEDVRRPNRERDAARKPDEGHPGPSRHPHLQAHPPQGRREARRSAHGGGNTVATEHACRDTPSTRALARRARADPRDRAGTAPQTRGGSSRGERPSRDGSAYCTSYRRRRRDGGHAGQRESPASGPRRNGRRQLGHPWFELAPGVPIYHPPAFF